MSSPIREVHEDGWRVRLDLGQQVLEIEVPETNYTWCGDDETGELLLPVPPVEDDGPVSAATLLLKAKQFDDGLYAAVDLAAQQGMGCFAGKASLLRALAETLAAGLPGVQGAAAVIHAACELGGVDVAAPADLRQEAHRIVTDFLRDELASKPLGFYTWTAELAAIFRQDRFLQQPVDPCAADDLVRALTQTSGAAATHAACLRLNSRLTNPPDRTRLFDGTGRRSILPASRSHEQVLVERLFGNRPIPEGFDLMTALIRRVRSGKIELEPTEQSGWYDHQTWSLEPLIVPDAMPESAHVKMGKRYREHLEDLFRGALAQARETHVKHLAIPLCGRAGPLHPPIRIRPDLSVEPLPSLYVRRAASYRFVRSVLVEVFGTEALEQMHRLTKEGAVATTLADELDLMERLFDGAAATARRELGMDVGEADEESVLNFARWQTGMATDPDVSRDCRMMVPVFFDLQRAKMKVWAFLGWRIVPVVVKYATEPVVLEAERESSPEPADRFSALRRKFRKQREEPAGPPVVEFQGDSYRFAVPVMVEVYVSRLLDRDEFRRHCDRYRTREAILANLA
jgi:hypothetical protein